jgi:hypothetical protein
VIGTCSKYRGFPDGCQCVLERTRGEFIYMCSE